MNKRRAMRVWLSQQNTFQTVPSQKEGNRRKSTAAPTGEKLDTVLMDRSLKGYKRTKLTSAVHREDKWGSGAGHSPRNALLRIDLCKTTEHF